MHNVSTLRQRLLPANPLRRFFRGKAPLVPPIKLDRHCVYILPTRAGLGFVAMIFVVLIGAMNYQNNLAYLLGFSLISLIIVTMTETYRQLIGLTISIGHIEPVFCGQSLKVPVIIKSKSQQRFSIELDKQTLHSCHDLAPPQSTIVLNIPADKRGMHKLGLLRITSRFPLGLFYAWTPMPMDVEYLIYPQAEINPPAAIPITNSETQTGSNKSGDDDFSGIKTYHPGDAPKHIHWKAYAKGQGLHSKQFATSQHPQRWFDWDETTGLPLEKRLSRLTAWLLTAERNSEDVGLRMPHVLIELGNSTEHLHRCLKVLALYQQEQIND